MRRLVATVALVLVLFGATHTAVAAAPETRVALVIGNSVYEDAPLATPVNDARLMAETLRGLGFEVIERTDANQKEMKLAIFELGDGNNPASEVTSDPWNSSLSSTVNIQPLEPPLSIHPSGEPYQHPESVYNVMILKLESGCAVVKLHGHLGKAS